MSDLDLQVADGLLAIEEELRRLGLGESVPPPAEFLESQLPFCCDTLTLGQWLQFIFIVRMKKLLESGAPLPSHCGIAPYAEEYFRNSGVDNQCLEKLLRQMDELLSRSRPPGPFSDPATRQ